MRIAVVGGGIAGLTAAYRLRQALGDDAELTVFDAADRPGGKLRTESLAGVDVDVGAEAFLVRRPEAVALAEELGFGERVVHPTSMRPLVRAGGRTATLPTGTLMGIPASAEQVAGVLSEDGVAAVAAEPSLPPPEPLDHDVSLGALLRERFGDELVDRLVDPLLAGVYAGGADSLGLLAVLPALAERIDAGTASLTEAVAGLLPPASTSSEAPVFGTLPGGLGVLVDALVDATRAEVVTGAVVRELRRTEPGWTLSVTSAAGTRTEDCDAVLLAVPAPAARKLLASAGAERAASDLADIELASMAVVALALPSGTALPEASGILIGVGETWDDGTPFTAKAFTLSSRKWAHLESDHDGPVLLRGSVGRFGEQGTLRATDDELIRRVRADLAELTGITAQPVAATVCRWGGGLPQYGVGHLERVARVERDVAALGRIALAGATWHGVGIPACVGTASAAAHELADQLLSASALVGD
ncbi:protoporphyrinogen oxidase [Haloechinothrix salitolerans]|uniref:Coproporphyrinogen III oxidase n=1 Tax=Haloechinothrix salitolerans TaxID=926830 RepID=A0ABW2C2V0_9PSEU